MRRTTPLFAVLGALVLLGLVGYFALRASRVDAHLAQALSSKTRADVSTIEMACTEYAVNNNGHYPDSLEPLLVSDVNGQSYLKVATPPLRDPWGREYLYEPPATPNAKPRIWSNGRDGKPGGEDEDQDIGNWMLR